MPCAGTIKRNDRRRRYYCGKRHGAWIIVQVVYIAGQWLPFQLWGFDSFESMTAAINESDS